MSNRHSESTTETSGCGHAGAEQGSCGSATSVAVRGGGVAAATEPECAANGVHLFNSSWHYGDTVVCNGSVTLKVADADANADADGVVLSADTLKKVVAQAQQGRHEKYSAKPGPATTPGPVWSRLLRWPLIAVPVGGLAFLAALALAGALVVVLSSAPAATTSQPPDWPNLMRREAWNANPALGRTKLQTPVRTIIVQHTADGPALCLNTAACILRVQDMQKFHMAKGWDDIGYNFLAGGDGRMYEGRGWDTVSATLSGWNSESLGVAFIGNFVATAIPVAQRDALWELLYQGVARGKVRSDYRLIGACQVRNTLSPGHFGMDVLKRHDHWWNHTSAESSCAE